MVNGPRVVVELEQLAAPRALLIGGPHRERVAEFVGKWREATRIDMGVGCRVVASPKAHVGLGLGTQLGLAVASGLSLLASNPLESTRWGDWDRTGWGQTCAGWAKVVGRGARSAVGTHGFAYGGLIAERGKCGNDVGELVQRIDLPREWCVLLICPTQKPMGSEGLHGDAEQRAFEQLHTVPSAKSRAISEQLTGELFDALLPAARQGDFDTYSESLFRYGEGAGKLFSDYQAGTYASESAAEMVAWIRSCGVRGVGQSSWGPTLFCWFPHREVARNFQRHLEQHCWKLGRSYECVIAPVASQGARFRRWG